MRRSALPADNGRFSEPKLESNVSVIRMQDLDLRGKRVLIREDLNVPVENGKITSTQRLDASLPTIVAARDAGAKVMVISHLGRPKEGEFDEALLLGLALRLDEADRACHAARSLAVRGRT